MSPVTSAPHWLIIVALLGLLGMLLFVKLSAAGYPRTFAASLSAVALVHPAFPNPASGVVSVLFALVAFAMAISAIAFAHSPDARRTILLGGSLAGAQLVNPICGVLSAISVPVILRESLVSGQTGRTLGQIISVLFIPALIAVLLMFAWIGRHENSFPWSSKSGLHLFDGGEALAHCAMGIAPLAIWSFALRQKAGGICDIVGLLCAIFIATDVIDSFLGIRSAPDVTAAVGPLTVLVLSTSGAKAARVSSTLLPMMSSVAACWLPAGLIARFAGV